MKESLLVRLKKGEIFVADGATGTMLFERGVKQGACPEAVNLEHPGLLEEIAGQYLEAGADMLQTNTFGASPAKLARYGLEEKTEEINRAAVRAVKNVAGEKAYISGSCGPTGKILKPYGDADPNELLEGFKRQIGAMAEEGVDLVCVETMMDTGEALLALEAAKRISKDLPVICSMTFNETPRGFYTIMGSSVEKAARILEDGGADIIGSNCGNGIDAMVKIADTLGDVTTLPILIQSNAGLPEMKDGVLIYPETPEYFAKRVEPLIRARVQIIGGCCGTTPAHIRAIRDGVRT